MAVALTEADNVKRAQVLGKPLGVDIVVRIDAKGEVVQIRERLHGICIVAVGDDMARTRHEARKFAERALHGV